MPRSLAERANEASAGLVQRAAAASWRGPDPYDGLYAHWPGPLVGGRRRRQAVIQLHARAPFDVRRLYRREHPRIAKTLALHGLAGLRSGAQQTGLRALEALAEDRSAGAGWGYPFDVQTRW